MNRPLTILPLVVFFVAGACSGCTTTREPRFDFDVLRSVLEITEPQGPRKPGDLGYQEVTVTDADRQGFDDLYGRDATSWEGTPLALRYGPRDQFGQDLSPAGVAKEVVRLIRVLGDSTNFKNVDQNGPRIKESLLYELWELVEALQSSETALEAVSERFRPVTRSNGEVVSPSIFFEGADHQLILVRFEILSDGARQPIYYATVDQAIEIRTICSLIEHIFAEVRKKPFERITEKLAKIDNGWTNYLEHGFSQYPWEAIVNQYVTPSLFGESSWSDPPRSQIVLLHPELGTLLDVRSTSGEGADAALLVHGLGYIHYFGDEREWFLGASGTIAFGDGDTGSGLGPTLHFGHKKYSSKVPHVSVSLLWQDYDGGSDGPVVAVSLDFWRLLDEGKESPARLLSGSD